MVNSININPFIKGYNDYAIPLSILTRDTESYNILLYNDYLNIQYTNRVFLQFYGSKYLNFYEGTLNIYYFKLSKTCIKNLNIEFEIIKSFIDNGYYLVFYANEYYIPHRNNFNIKGLDHDSLLYGYDNKENIFYIAGYTEKGVYEKSIIKEEDFINGIYGTNIDDIYFYFLKPNNNFKPEFDLSRCLTSLKGYLHSQDSYNLYDNNTIFGLDCYQHLINLMWEIYNKYGNVDWRPFHLIYEHTKIMQACIEYLFKFQYVRKYEFIENYIDIVKGWTSIRNLCIKYKTMNTKDQNIVKRLELLIKQFVEKETKILSQLEKELDNIIS